MAEARGRPTIDAGTAIRYGIIGGIIAGIVFAIGEMILAPLLLGASPLAPLQMIGAILLGPAVLPPAEATAGVAIAGVVVHLILSAIYGVVLALIVAAIPALRSSIGVLTLVGLVYGLVLWIVNFFVIAPVAFPWFTVLNVGNGLLMQFIAHVIFFGAVLGYYLGTKLAQPARAL